MIMMIMMIFVTEKLREFLYFLFTKTDDREKVIFWSRKKVKSHRKSLKDISSTAVKD